jgi:hypothetical protein
MIPTFPYGHPEGEFFCVRDDIVASSTRDLVTPKALRRDPVSGVIGDRFIERNGIIILGFAFELRGNAASFTLESWDDAAVSGPAVAYPIWKSVTDATATASTKIVITPTFIPLSPAEAAPTPVNGALLRYTAGAGASGWVMVWGIHGTAAQGFGDGYTGSPRTF